MTNNQELIAEAEAHIESLMSSFAPDSKTGAAIRRGEGADPRISLVIRLTNALEAATPRVVSTDDTDLPTRLAEELSRYDEFWDGAPEDGWRFHRDVAALIGWEASEEPPGYSLDHLFGDVPAQLAALTIRVPPMSQPVHTYRAASSIRREGNGHAE